MGAYEREMERMAFPEQVYPAPGVVLLGKKAEGRWAGVRQPDPLQEKMGHRQLPVTVQTGKEDEGGCFPAGTGFLRQGYSGNRPCYPVTICR
jgi:hypothetical protein